MYVVSGPSIGTTKSQISSENGGKDNQDKDRQKSCEGLARIRFLMLGTENPTAQSYIKEPL